MTTLQQLRDQRAALETAIENARRQQRSEALTQIRGMMDRYGLSAADVLATRSVRKASAIKGRKAPVKFRDIRTGESWTGRGSQPRWLKAALAAGRTIREFEV